MEKLTKLFVCLQMVICKKYVLSDYINETKIKILLSKTETCVIRSRSK